MRVSKIKNRRKGDVERKIINVLADILARKFALKRREHEESYVPALHRTIGGPGHIPFCDFFRALRGLKTLFSFSDDKCYFRLVDEILVNAHPMDLHQYHDRRSY